MGIPVTIEFLSSLRSSLQLLVIKNRIKTTTKKSTVIRLKFTQNVYTRTLKQACKGILIQKLKIITKIIKLRIRCGFRQDIFRKRIPPNASS